MLTVTVPGVEYFNEETNRFITIGDQTIDFEHSLVSLSKWEETYEKAFLGPGEKTQEETFGYLKCMCLTPDVDEEVFTRLNSNVVLMQKISDYINSKMTATTFPNEKKTGPAREIVTAEVIYYWMVSMQIPFEAQYWHLNKLFTLIKVISLKNQPAKKMSRREILEQQRQLNAQRRAQLNTRG